MRYLPIILGCLGLLATIGAHAQQSTSFTVCVVDRIDSTAVPDTEVAAASSTDTSVVYTGADGCASVAVRTETSAEPAARVPGTFRIQSSYPNPFSRRATVAYDLARPGTVRACLFDVLGRRMACSEPAYRQPGRHEAVVDGARLAPGLYAVRLDGEAGSVSTVLVKTGGRAGEAANVTLDGGAASHQAPAVASLHAAGATQEAAALSFRVRKEAYIERTVTETVTEGDTVWVALTAEEDEAQVTYIDPASDAPTVYAIGVETGHVMEVVDSAGYQIRWAPDGRRLAYLDRYENYLEAQIYVMEADGTDRRVVTLWEHEGRIEPRPIDTNSDPVWSPDGERIAYTRCMNCEVGGLNYEVFIVDLDTTEGVREVQLTHNPVGDYVQDWSPDGQKILFMSSYASDGSWDSYADTYEMNVDGSDRRRILVSDSTYGGYRARYSPDGTQIAFIAQPEGASYEIYVANRDGTEERQVTDNDLREYYVTWSPDGTRLAFTTSSGSSWYHPGHLYVINVDGTGLRQLTAESGAYSPPEWWPRPRSSTERHERR